VLVVAAGGGAGSLLRYGMGRHWPVGTGFPTSTLLINLSGSLLLGALVVAVTDIWRPHRLLRPALGTGVLGGYTTFSTFSLEVRTELARHAWGIATGYLAASVVGGLAAAALGMWTVRAIRPRLSVAGEHEYVDPLDPDLP
jgi:CrcB protein